MRRSFGNAARWRLDIVSPIGNLNSNIATSTGADMLAGDLIVGAVRNQHFGKWQQPFSDGASVEHVILSYRSDYKCSHSIAISADQWPDDVRIRSSGIGSAGARASSTARARLAGAMFSLFAMGAWLGAATH